MLAFQKRKNTDHLKHMGNCTEHRSCPWIFMWHFDIHLKWHQTLYYDKIYVIWNFSICIYLLNNNNLDVFYRNPIHYLKQAQNRAKAMVNQKGRADFRSNFERSVNCSKLFLTEGELDLIWKMNSNKNS